MLTLNGVFVSALATHAQHIGSRVYAASVLRRASSVFTLTINHGIPPGREAFGFEARIDGSGYGSDDPQDAAGDAGNDDEAVVAICNVALGTTLTLDLSDPSNPRRVAEDGVTEVAGYNNEDWVDFPGAYFAKCREVVSRIDHLPFACEISTGERSRSPCIERFSKSPP